MCSVNVLIYDFFIQSLNTDQYPSSVRPFYTMLNQSRPQYSNSYDVFMRGQEISSGAQRCHLPDMLLKQIEARGLDAANFESYLSAFKHGMLFESI